MHQHQRMIRSQTREIGGLDQFQLFAAFAKFSRKTGGCTDGSR
jgi:hypothetical protein